MPAQQDTFLLLARHLLLVLDPLRRGFTTPENFKGLLYNLGWKAGDLPTVYIELGAAITDAVNTAEELSDGPVQASEAAEMLGKAKTIYDALKNGLPAPANVDPARITQEIGGNLVDALITEYLSREHPQVYALLQALEVIRFENLSPEAPAGATPVKHGYVRTVIAWDQIPNLLKDPHLILGRVYGWGTDELKTPVIMHHLGTFLYGLGFPISIIGADERTISAYAGTGSSIFGSGRERGLKFPFHYDFIADQPIELSFQLLPLLAKDELRPGLVIQPGIPENLPFDFALSDDTRLNIVFSSNLAEQFGLLIRPEGLSFKYPFQNPEAAPIITLGIAVAYSPEEPVMLLGKPDGARLEMKGYTIALKATGPVDDIDAVLSADVHELSVVLAAGEGDGFLRTLLGDGETKIDVPLGIDWSSKHGLGFRGSLNFEVQLHPHLEIGPLKIPDLRLSLTITPEDPAKARIEGAITLAGKLGPLAFVAEGIGVQALFGFQPGNLGPMDLQLGFRPPDGVGLSIDAGAVRGGGFLRYDAEREEYAGMLQLSMMDMLTISAVGMITTRMPDGSDGFSFLAVISVEFNPGIQLGFGFTLLGLGGIVGLNRGLALDALAAGVKSGSTNNILFPTGDIIAQAPRIISDLRTIFPPEEGTFLIGPMAKIGWGTPTLVSITMGVIIEIPGDLAIVGVLRVALPTTDAPLILIQAAFVGAFQPDRQRLWFYARLFESRLLNIPLEGSMGLLMAWGDDANFVVSVGGFHPSFDPPALPFPELERISYTILDKEHASIRVESYHAVTSNTVQFGASAEIYFGYSDFCVEGHLGFDALFQFSPFYFIIEVRAGLTLKIFGFDTCNIKLAFTLEGPTPWHAHGTGSIGFLFWDFDVDFDEVWGDGADTALPPVQVLPLFRAELEKRENWKTALPPANNLLVSIRDLSDATGDLVMHPLGSLRFSQRLVPVGLTFDKLGNQRPSDVKRFDIEAEPGSGLVQRGSGNERFAMAQFLDMGEEEKLSLPAFASVPGGIDLGVADALRTSRAACRTVRYEETWLDSEYKKHQDFGSGFDRGLFGHYLGGAAITSCKLSAERKKKMNPFADKVKVTPDMGYAVADLDTNAVHAAGGVFGSHAMARERMLQAIAVDPGLVGRLVVVPESELMN